MLAATDTTARKLKYELTHAGVELHQPPSSLLACALHMEKDRKKRTDRKISAPLQLFAFLNLENQVVYLHPSALVLSLFHLPGPSPNIGVKPTDTLKNKK